MVEGKIIDFNFDYRYLGLSCKLEVKYFDSQSFSFWECANCRVTRVKKSFHR